MIRSRRNTSSAFHKVLDTRMSRRRLLGASAGIAAAGFVGGFFRQGALAANASSLTFEELTRTYDQTHHIAAGYRADVLVRWGDKLSSDAGEFDPAAADAKAQQSQFGYNCDFTGYLPLPAGSNNSDHGLLCVNNEYGNPHVMFAGLGEDEAGAKMTDQQLAYLATSIGHSVVEIEKRDSTWAIVQDSAYNRRIHLGSEFAISGPAAGHALLKTNADPTGTTVFGTIYNCGGGVTPWGTVLSGEEGASDTFAGDANLHPDPALIERYGYDGSDYYGFGRLDARFHLDKEPNEPNRFDWVVEIDPYDPAALPVKRTALGRFAHEGAQCVLNKDGRVVVYMGDDDYFEYLYRFVSAGQVNLQDRAANKSLLDDGVLSVAVLSDDGALNWLPLVHGQGPLTAENGFADQAEVLIKARLAADLLGGTPMDRPEDFEANPVTGRVYAVMTKNKKRTAENVNASNSRAENHYGHIIELIPPGEGAEADHAADRFEWDIFVLCGDPSKPEQGATFAAETSENGWFVTPDNIAFDPKGRLWVATDGANDFDLPDGIYGVDTLGEARALPKFLFGCPTDAEATGPCFTPDGKTLFVSVQHPAEGSENLSALTTTWPDFDANRPMARPSVVAIQREDGAEVGA